MVDTNGIGGVQLYNEKSRTKRFGIAVVPDVVSYNSFIPAWMSMPWTAISNR